MNKNTKSWVFALTKNKQRIVMNGEVVYWIFATTGVWPERILQLAKEYIIKNKDRLSKKDWLVLNTNSYENTA